MPQKVITICFYLLFFLTPLIWSPANFELFEYDKMMVVYGLTVIIIAAWLIKMVSARQLVFKHTPLDWPLLAFLVANIISTITSMNPHVSVWGYYSRSNGGLLSTISYITLYYALVSNFTAQYALKFIKAALFGGAIVALYAIPEHFGASPSCLILNHQLTDRCWVQDVQARVFATLGQPNWLAAYLAMLIFPAIYFFLTSASRSSKVFYFLLFTFYYLAFTFTYSRGGTLGFLISLAVFIPTLLLRFNWGGRLNLIAVLLSLCFVSLFFGTALTDFKLISAFAPPPRPALTAAASGMSQLENGGTESGEIRLIVWKGALDIFRHYPLFGSGVETFAYSYYQYRPLAHNMVSEWDFLYNKAHNEYLNYLATTGLIGFISYMSIIAVFIWWSMKYVVLSIKGGGKNFSVHHTSYFVLALAAAYVSYLIQNFFGFSVVIIAMFFYLFPALAFLVTDSAKPATFPKYNIPNTICSLIYRRSFYSKLAKSIILVLAAAIIFTLAKYWVADTIFAQGEHASDANNPGRAYNDLADAAALNPGEPYYRSELGFAAASAAVALQQDDATASATLAIQADDLTKNVLQKNSTNVSFWRTAIRTYFMLSVLDPKFNSLTIDAVNQAIALAPTDPKLMYNKGIILNQQGKNQEAVAALLEALKLKPNYRDVYFTLADVYNQLNQKDKAVSALESYLKYAPGDAQTMDKISKLEAATTPASR